MAIQFPPVSEGDAQPVDGDTYLYLVTGEEFVCRRSSLDEAAQWAAQGSVKDTILNYKGTLEILQPAPADASLGNIYSVIDGGIADSSFTGLAGAEVAQWSLVIFTDPTWSLVNSAATSPWVRTMSGRIMPLVETDDLDMDEGNYLINELPTLQGPIESNNITEIDGLSRYIGDTEETLGYPENVVNACGAVNGNTDTFAYAVNSKNTIHVLSDDPFVSVASSIEVKIQPNHWVMFGTRATPIQADADGIASSNMSGSIDFIRVSDTEDDSSLPDTSEIRLYYILVDDNYLVDPTC